MKGPQGEPRISRTNREQAGHSARSSHVPGLQEHVATGPRCPQGGVHCTTLSSRCWQPSLHWGTSATGAKGQWGHERKGHAGQSHGPQGCP